MPVTPVQYSFENITFCNMCGSSTASHKVLGRRLNNSQGKNPKNKKGITVSICKCDNCGLIYSNPMPVPLSISDHYGVDPAEYWKPEYFKIEEDYMLTQLQLVKKLLGSNSTPVSLDIGAGLGKGMIAMQKQGFDVYGFEASRNFYETALEKMKIPPERLQLGQIENVNYPENHFDFISFGAVLEHLYDPDNSIRRAMKWLKPGGIIHIEVPSSNWLMNRLANIYYRLILTDFVANISPMHEPYHLYEFSLNSFKHNAEKNKFTIAYHEFYPVDLFLPKGFGKFLLWLMKKTDTGMQLAVYLRKGSHKS